MIRIFFTLLAFIISQSSIAQTQKGSFLVGGNLTVDFSETDHSIYTFSSNNFSASPKVGYFPISNFCFGSTFPWSVYASKLNYNDPSSDDRKQKGSSLGAGPFVRYYFPIRRFLIITETSYTWNKDKYEFDSFNELTGEKYKSDGLTKTKTFQAAAGVGFVLEKNLSIELLINYESLDNKFEEFAFSNFTNEYKQTRIFISLGFQIYLSKKTGE